MISYIAFNLFYYKNKEYKQNIKNLIHSNFKDDLIVYPYSLNSEKELHDILKIKKTGVFLIDIKKIISKCESLIIFTTEKNYIGSGIYIEYLISKKFNLELLSYNKNKNKFCKNFNIIEINKNKNFCFNKQIKFNE